MPSDMDVVLDRKTKAVERPALEGLQREDLDESAGSSTRCGSNGAGCLGTSSSSFCLRGSGFGYRSFRIGLQGIKSGVVPFCISCKK